MMSTLFLLAALLLALPCHGADGIAITSVQANTGGGTQDITVSGIGTPNGVLFFISKADQDRDVGLDVQSLYHVGGFDGTRQRSARVKATDAVDTSITGRGQSASNCILTDPVSGFTLNGTASCAFITDGVRLTWSVNPTLAYYIIAVFFYGDTTLYLNHFSSAIDVGDSVVVTDPGAEPDVLFLWSTGANLASANFLGGGIGFADNQLPITQASVANANAHSVDTTEIAGLTSATRALQTVDADSLEESIEITAFSSTGFTATTRSAGSVMTVFYAAIFLDGGSKHWVGIEDTPTSTGNHTHSNSGIAPIFVLALPSNATAVDTRVTANDTLMGYQGVCASTASTQACNGIVSDDAADISNEASVYDNVPMLSYAGNETLAYIASFTGFESVSPGGMTLNYTTVPGVPRKVPMLIIGSSPSTSGRRRGVHVIQ